MRTQPPPSPWPSGTLRLRVGDVLVDLRYRQVRHGTSVTELPQRMFDLLQVFLAEPHALHTRGELFERVWGDLVVEDANLSQSVWMLRKALGPERKDWIRTVAKQGYVFAPPTAVEALQDDVAASPAAATGAEDPARRGAQPASAPGWSRGLRIAGWSAATLALVVAVWGAVAWRGRDARTIVPQQQANIALLEVHDRAAPGVNWPADLAHAWLAWKLRSLPEVTLLGESDLAADTGRIAPTVVMLSCASGGPGEVVLRARFDDRRQSPIEVRGPVAQVPRLADELSRQALARLVPRRAREQWPELVLDVASARDYAKAQDALERRDWSGSLPILRKVVRQAPRFGLAQLDLARAESSLGQAGPAVAAMNAARLNLRPLPADAQRLLDARALAVDPQRNNEAAAAYAALARSWPQRYDILLDHAGYLADAGKPEEARAILQRPEWAQRRTSLRIARLLALARVDAALGDLQGSKAHASQALAMARAAGEGWANERGAALVLLAQLDSALHSTHPDNPLYEQAAREFDASGATADALYARVQRELVRPPGRQGNSTGGVDTLLAKAHAEGYRRLEIELLRSVAYQHYQAGQLAAYRELMEQALAAADNAGDVQQQQFFDIDLLGQDYLRGDFASAGRRIARLRKAGLQGSAADAVRGYEALITAMRGNYGQALVLIDAGLRKSPGAPALAAARSACSRADLLQQQGELTRARTLWLRCAAPDQDALRALARLGRASNDLLAGDRPAALAALRELAAQTNTTLTGPDRWQSATNIAPLLLRAGDVDGAEALLLPILADVRDAGYGLVLAQAEAALAEVEAARGHWDASRAHAKAARNAIPADVWVVTSRLDNLDIADALARGERNDAETLLARGDANAHRHHDAIAQLELHGLMSPTARLPDGCDATARKALLARTGMRGASLDWLFGPLATRDPLGRLARH